MSCLLSCQDMLQQDSNMQTSAVQVTHAVLKDGTKLEAQLVVAGVGARPNTELLQGQIDLLEDKPGGIKVIGSAASLPCLLSVVVCMCRLQAAACAACT